MNTLTKGAAKRPIISLLLLALLTGCAVYDPGYPYSPAYGSAYGTSPYDSYPYGAYPYGPYGADVYGPPYYSGPAVQFGFGFRGERQWHHRGDGHRGDGRRGDGRWDGRRGR
jgi:hypothetical protein